ncbi:hypothetical protein ST47_g3584 [Ascochyta rabiei]|uniref:Uncharacterized protein n=1 Tax=Didymella rabiei TaxID=5454 RepID=A0A163HFA7_DIDRA|nr:hypothetical protein ST47_g3584 [Ascochyta rabiei]
MEAALLSSLALMRTPTKSASTPRPKSSTTTTTPVPASLPSTPEPQTPRKPRRPTTPLTPRKRARPSTDPLLTPYTPKRTRTTLPTSPSTPSKLPRTRRKKALAFDREVCISMAVLRAQKDDPSALLRPPPRRSDGLRRLVRMRIQWELEKVRGGGERIVESVIGPVRGRKVGKQG